MGEFYQLYSLPVPHTSRHALDGKLDLSKEHGWTKGKKKANGLAIESQEGAASANTLSHEYILGSERK